MQVTVRFFAAYRERAGERQATFEIPTGTTVSGLVEHVLHRFPALAGVVATSAYAVNQEYADPTTPLQTGDEVAFLPPVSGGAGEASALDVQPYVVVTEEPISAEALIPRLLDPSVGAVVTFTGVVRGFSRGKPIEHLEYEAYPAMAERSLRQICLEIRERYRVDRAAIAHRIGRLAIGETAVAIAVASPHRKEAFRACEYAIDRIKEHTPIWKKEIWTDGSTWIGREGG
ncbi:MAG: molybdopterin converting factor subunit 1 [Chloroflexi bacterium]|nr:molybdopterin converting factor subunit 1 [Chloroflexota bacterium]